MRDESRIEFGRNRLAGGILRRISWAAIFAGVATTLGISILLTTLGAGIGAGSINPLQESNPLQGLGAGAVIWMIITGIVAFFIGGWVAAYGSGWTATRMDMAIHGLATWAVATLIGLWFLTGAAGALVSGSAAVLGQAVSGGAQAAGQAPELSAALRQELERRGIDLRSLEQQSQSPEARARAEEIARQTGQRVASGVSKAALGGFAVMLIDLLASIFGALSAFYRGRETTVTTEKAA